MGLRIEAAPFGLADTGRSAVLDLFSFEEMTTLSNEARILSLLANGNRNLTTEPRADGQWLEISGIRAAEFKLLAAHPRLLETARQVVNGPVRAGFLQLWVADGRTATGRAVSVPPAGADQINAIVCLAGAANLAMPTQHGPYVRATATLHSGSVLWVAGSDGVVLEPEPNASALMLCVITYAALGDASRAASERQELQAVADDSLWPSAYVIAG